MDNICSAVEDCQKPAFRRGWCSMHYSRWQRYGSFDVVNKPGKKRCLGSCWYCDESAVARNLCGKHYQRWAKFGDPLHTELDREQPVEQRFWSKVDKNGPVPEYAPELGPCWLWTAGLADGYGVFSIGNRQRKAHILSYTWAYGDIPENWERDHLCRVTNCVRPEHIQAVSPRINKIRGFGWSGLSHHKNHSEDERYCVECDPFRSTI